MSSSSDDDDDDDDEGEIYTTGTPFQPSNHRVFTVNFFGSSSINTIVTSNTSIIRKWIHATLIFNRRVRDQHPLIVGLGVQWDPDGDDGTTADTLQFCVGNRCLIIQLSRVTSVPVVLRRFLADEHNIFVGLRNYTDAKRLLKCEHSLSVWRILDLCSYVRLNNASMESMASDVLGLEGVTKDPEIGRSDWGKNLLNKEQVEYACVDALVSYKVGMAWEAWNF